MSIKLKDVETKLIKENDGSYAIACSALGVYSIGKTLAEAKKNFEEALDLHLSVMRQAFARSAWEALNPTSSVGK